MRRLILVALGAVALPAVAMQAPTAAQQRDWSKVAAETAEGGFRLGNPDAPVKLVEYASLTCSHCATFHNEAMPELKSGAIARGGVSYEFRNFVLNPIDLAASLIARCGTGSDFFQRADYFLGEQQQWMRPFGSIPQAERERISKLPQDQMLGAAVAAAGLEGKLAARGIPAAKVRACLADKAELQQLLTLRQAASEKYKIEGTPTFLINGKVAEGNDWAAIKPLLSKPGG